jgi:hypothetical protein
MLEAMGKGLFIQPRVQTIFNLRYEEPGMAEPENQTLHLLRELREQNEATHGDLSSLRSEVREGFEGVSERLKNFQQAIRHSGAR